jgi:hypothetical protein
MFRLTKMIHRGIESFSISVRHSFNHAPRRALLLFRATGAEEMQKHITHYHTNGEARTCDCGLSAYFSGMNRIFVPYCHLLAAEVPKDRMSHPPVLVHQPMVRPWDLVKIALAGAEPPMERREPLVRMAAHSIKQQSRTGRKLVDVVDWVKDSFPSPDAMVTFVQNIPVVILELISLGVMQFGRALPIEAED